MKKNNPIPLGVIEGFFGRSWDFTSRAAYANFLAQHQLDFYIYAPKNDSYLRRQWQQDWPLEEKQSLIALRDIYAKKQIQFGIGLSPLGIWQENQDPGFHLFRQRLQQINELSPDILCILFDDMRGDLPQLAALQIELAHIAAETSHARQIIFCPTYYSTDPILEKVFGKKPDDYWEDLGRGLDQSIDIFWTGEKVCSESYSAESLQWIASQLQRKVFLWDNYPVNDGAIKSERLHLLPFHPSHSDLKYDIKGHAANPMNQAWLSQLALSSLSNIYREHALPTEQIFIDLLGHQLGQELLKDAEFFQTQGIKDITFEQKQQLLNRYQVFLPNPFATEVIDWLNGKYVFDPACLTE